MQAHPSDFSSSALRVLRVDASARSEDSLTRRLADRLIAGLGERVGELSLMHRDLAEGLAFVDASWVEANLTDPADRSAAQRATLAQSDALVEELKAADVLVIATPIYNFGVPASLKAWVDQVARARLTFRYTEQGPQGLLRDRKTYIVVASGGTEVGGPIDFATPWLTFVLGFLGIRDVEVIAADRGMQRGDEARLGAAAAIEAALARDWPARAAA
ncbi:MAG: FMN-dependent NADH-azoreductase [Thiobacillus sp.]